MQGIRLECTFDGDEYKEYQVFTEAQLLGIISWGSQDVAPEACWYTIASDGDLRYFQTQEEAIAFLRSNRSDTNSEISVQLKAEARKLTAIADGLESTSIEPKEDEALREQVEEVKAGVEELEVKFKGASTETNLNL